MRIYLFILVAMFSLCEKTVYAGDDELILLTQGLKKLTLSAWEEALEKFNLNKQVPRKLMRGPKEFIEPDPARVVAAFRKLDSFIWGRDYGWDEKKERAFSLRPKQYKSSAELRKEFLGAIDGHDMSFLSEHFDECDCADFGRVAGFISIRDLVEKKIADMIVAELSRSKSVRYISVGAGGYYFDFRMLRRACLAWEQLAKGKGTLEVFFVDLAARYIPDFENIMKQPQYTCKNLDLKLRTASLPFEDFPKTICPTIIGGIDINVIPDFPVLRLCLSCGSAIKGVFLVDLDAPGVDIDENYVPNTSFFTVVAKDDTTQIKRLQQEGYQERPFEKAPERMTPGASGSEQEKISVDEAKKYTRYVKLFHLDESGIKLFTQELKSAGLVD